MVVVIAAFGILQVLGGVIVYLAAASAIHQILASVSFGLGIAAIGLAAILFELKNIGERIDAREASDIVRHEASMQRLAG